MRATGFVAWLLFYAYVIGILAALICAALVFNLSCGKWTDPTDENITGTAYLTQLHCQNDNVYQNGYTPFCDRSLDNIKMAEKLATGLLVAVIAVHYMLPAPSRMIAVGLLLLMGLSLFSQFWAWLELRQINGLLAVYRIPLDETSTLQSLASVDSFRQDSFYVSLAEFILTFIAIIGFNIQYRVSNSNQEEADAFMEKSTPQKVLTTLATGLGIDNVLKATAGVRDRFRGMVKYPDQSVTRPPPTYSTSLDTASTASTA
jgi:hypothetical protein